MLHIIVGSTNPVKVNAVQAAAAKLAAKVEVEGVSVPSGVSEQPFSDLETKTGATQRAQAAFQVGAQKYSPQQVLGVGLEGGVMEGEDGQLWSTVWAAVCDASGQCWLANGGRIAVPEPFAAALRNGQELGPLVAQVTGIDNVKHKQGMFGIITQDYVSRTDGYTSIAKMALGVWHGRNWHQRLQK